MDLVSSPGHSHEWPGDKATMELYSVVVCDHLQNHIPSFTLDTVWPKISRLKIFVVFTDQT